MTAEPLSELTARLRALHAAATAGEWAAYGHVQDDGSVWWMLTQADTNHWIAASGGLGDDTPAIAWSEETDTDRSNMQYAAAAVNALPRLLQEIDRLELAESVCAARLAKDQSALVGMRGVSEAEFEEWSEGYQSLCIAESAAYEAWRAARPDAAGSDEEAG